MGAEYNCSPHGLEQDNKAEVSFNFLFKGAHPVSWGIYQPHLVNFLPHAKNMKLRSSLIDTLTSEQQSLPRLVQLVKKYHSNFNSSFHMLSLYNIMNCGRGCTVLSWHFLSSSPRIWASLVYCSILHLPWHSLCMARGKSRTLCLVWFKRIWEAWESCLGKRSSLCWQIYRSKQNG